MKFKRRIFVEQSRASINQEQLANISFILMTQMFASGVKQDQIVYSPL